jgi:hypothetical protein
VDALDAPEVADSLVSGQTLLKKIEDGNLT